MFLSFTLFYAFFLIRKHTTYSCSHNQTAQWFATSLVYKPFDIGASRLSATRAQVQRQNPQGRNHDWTHGAVRRQEVRAGNRVAPSRVCLLRGLGAVSSVSCAESQALCLDFAPAWPWYEW